MISNYIAPRKTLSPGIDFYSTGNTSKVIDNNTNKFVRVLKPFAEPSVSAINIRRNINILNP